MIDTNIVKLVKYGGAACKMVDITTILKLYGLMCSPYIKFIAFSDTDHFFGRTVFEDGSKGGVRKYALRDILFGLKEKLDYWWADIPGFDEAPFWDKEEWPE